MYFAVENNKGLFKGSGSDDVLREKFARQLKWCTDVMDVFCTLNEAEIKKCSTFSALSRMEGTAFLLAALSVRNGCRTRHSRAKPVCIL